MEEYDRDVTYLCKIVARFDVLIIELEQKDNGERWKNKYDCSYLEEITQRSGVPQKYQSFVRLLFLSINGNENVKIDIVNNQDLDKLRSKHSAKDINNQNKKQQNPEKAEKRYFVITVMIQENPDAETLKKTIARLRVEIEDLKEQQLTEILTATHRSDHDIRSEVIKLRVENQQLRRKLKDEVGEIRYHQMENSLGKTVLKKRESLGMGFTDNYTKQIEDLANELEQERYLNEKLRLEFDDFTKEDFLRRKRIGLDPEEEDFSFARHLAMKHKKEVDALIQQIEKYKDVERSQKLKIREAVSQYESTLKKYSALKNQVIRYFSQMQTEDNEISKERKKNFPSQAFQSSQKSQKEEKKPDLAEIFRINIPKNTKSSIKLNHHSSSKTSDILDTKQIMTELPVVSRDSKIPSMESRPQTTTHKKHRNPISKFYEDISNNTKKKKKDDDSDSSIDAGEIEYRLTNLQQLLDSSSNKFY